MKRYVIKRDMPGVGGMNLAQFKDVAAFFFSSRRRHTRWPRDWSSDVCSSDLVGEENVSVLTQMPLSLAYLKALTPAGWEVDIIDEMKEPALTADETAPSFDGADLVGITAMSH